MPSVRLAHRLGWLLLLTLIAAIITVLARPLGMPELVRTAFALGITLLCGIGVVISISSQRNARLLRARRSSPEFIDFDRNLSFASAGFPGALFRIIQDKQGITSIPFATEGIIELLGCTPKQLREDCSVALSAIEHDDLPRLVRSFTTSAIHLTPQQCEFRSNLPGRPPRMLLSHAIPERTSDGAVIWHGHLSDITNLRDAQERKERTQRLESLSTLAAGAAHDFNNILMVITGNASMIDRMSQDPNVRRIANNIDKATLRAKGLTDQLLALARNEPLAREPASIVEILNESAALALSSESNVRAEITAATPLPPVDVDPMQIVRVFQNLLVNAKQAMPGGGMIHLHAALVHEREDDEHFVRITVADNGIGIPATILPHIFETSFTTRKVHGGSGLGLAIVADIIKKHAGRISVTSKEKAGTTFEVLLPIAERRRLRRDPETGLPEERTPRRVLVLEDDPAVLDVIGLMLLALGHETKLVADGARAVEEFRTHEILGRRFDVVLMNLNVPGETTGFAALAAIRKIRKDTPAIISSGLPPEKNIGSVTYLQKPYKLGELDRAINHLMKA